MNKNKIAVLEAVIKRVENEGTIIEHYVDSNGCMCAVGHIFDECGVDMSLFNDYKLNGEFPSRLLCDREIFEVMEDYGFTGEELDELQNFNDAFDDDYSSDDWERAYNVMCYLKEMIEDIKKSA